MQKPLFNQFLFCCSLEAGGKIISYVSIVLATLLAIMSLILVVGITMLADEVNGDTKGVAIVLVVIFVIYIAFAVAWIVAGVLLIKGINRREHGKTIFMMIMLALSIVVNFLSLISTGYGVGNIIRTIITLIILIYCFLTVLNIHTMFKHEKEQPNYVANQQKWGA